jgi:hypothetical protein
MAAAGPELERLRIEEREHDVILQGGHDCARPGPRVVVKPHPDGRLLFDALQSVLAVADSAPFARAPGTEHPCGRQYITLQFSDGSERKHIFTVSNGGVAPFAVLEEVRSGDGAAQVLHQLTKDSMRPLALALSQVEVHVEQSYHARVHAGGRREEPVRYFDAEPAGAALPAVA